MGMKTGWPHLVQGTATISMHSSTTHLVPGFSPQTISRFTSCRLYFGRPVEAELIAVDAGLADEIRSSLSSLGRLPEDAELWGALEDYMGWENLEERWPGRIDPRVLAYLRAHAARGA